MAQTRTTCPRCHQPILAEIQQLFDVSLDPKDKQLFLSGQFNLSKCSNCGYEGSLSLPLVYHDPNKELLLTYFPPELGVSVNEQEKMIGPFITKVMNNLPAEKRKAYLLRPLAMFTLQTMIEKVLEADGITKEMLDAQQARLNLLQRLFSTSKEEIVEVIKTEEALIDDTFFALLNRLMEASIAQGDQQSARALAGLQQVLVENTEVGKRLKLQSQQAENAAKQLQDAAKDGLSREKLLEIILAQDNEVGFTTVVSMARGGLDYTFFQAMSEQIEQKQGEEKEKLAALRDKLLVMVKEIDKAMAQEVAETRELLYNIANSEDIEAALREHTEEVSEIFIEILKTELQEARQKGDMERTPRLQKVVAMLQKMSAPPPEVALAQELVAAKTEEARRAMLESHTEEINDEFVQMLNGLATQGESQGQPYEIIKAFQDAYKSALHFSMEKNLRG